MKCRIYNCQEEASETFKTCNWQHGKIFKQIKENYQQKKPLSNGISPKLDQAEEKHYLTLFELWKMN